MVVAVAVRPLPPWVPGMVLWTHQKDMCLTQGPSVCEVFGGIRKQRPLYVIIWTWEWAFLQGVCCGLSTCIWCKTGIPELGHSAGDACCVTLVRSCFNHSLLPSQCISTCMFYSRWSYGTCLEITRFHCFQWFRFTSLCIQGLTTELAACPFLCISLQRPMINSQTPAFRHFYIGGQFRIPQFFQLCACSVNKVKRFQNSPFNTEGSAEFASWPFPGARAIVPVRM